MNDIKKILAIILISIVTLAVGCSQKNDSPATKTAKSSKQPTLPKNAVKAPDFTLAKLDGSWFKLSDFKGKVVMLNFWGTWCPPCRREIPDFIKLMEKYNKDGLEIVGVTLTSGSAEKIQQFVDSNGMNYTLLTDIDNNETQAVTSRYGEVTGERINGIPTTFIIDRNGYIVKRYVGPRSEAIFYNDLKPYL
ncbi:MAG: TlpA family protein disulfide reductase [Candidatus Marinimicrobia bacterium]|nr:TlpA family protein disulfide reductase [Candidatus Neomarinimicrobiota bacterium]